MNDSVVIACIDFDALTGLQFPRGKGRRIFMYDRWKFLPRQNRITFYPIWSILMSLEIINGINSSD